MSKETFWCPICDKFHNPTCGQAKAKDLRTEPDEYYQHLDRQNDFAHRVEDGEIEKVFPGRSTTWLASGHSRRIN